MRYTLILALTLLANLGQAQPSLLKHGQAVFTFNFGCFQGTGSGNEWSMLVYDTRHTYDATPAVNWDAGFFYPSTADSIYWQRDSMGSVFGVTIDTIGNIYVAAASIYSGSKAGMAGFGGIYKVDAFDWSVSKFMKTGPYSAYDPTKNLMPNEGSALGDICYDRRHHQMFATNFEDGKIYRMDMNGTILSTFDPFTADAGASGAVLYSEMVWAINVYGTSKADQRLFFSRVHEDGCSPVAMGGEHNQVWAINLDPVTGNFSGAPVKILEKPYDMTFNEPFSDLCFDDAGNIYLAERSMCTGSTSAHRSRILKYTNTAGVYSAMEQYFIGNYSTNDAAGGLDIGRTYQDEDHFTCEDIIWASCDAFEFGPNYLYGLAGLPLSGNSNVVGDPDYYYDVNIIIDHDQEITASCIPKTSLGDIEVFRSCQGEDTITPPPPPPPPPPVEIDSCELIKNFILPNILTPNGDKKNDSLLIPELCEEGELLIFDRWGSEVHKSTGKDLKWDGRNKRREIVTEGVYYCIFRNPRMNKHWYIHVKK